ncbi:MAG: AMP-binding protein, partial [Gammaproteobacteria bacterium]
MESTQPVLRETPSLQKEISQTTHQKKRDMAVTPDSGHVLNSGQALCRQSTVAMRSAFLASMCEYGALPLERLAYRAKKHPGRAYLRQPIAGRMRVYTWGRVYHEARRMAAYLSSLMLPLGSRIALLSKNCAHWIMADYAIWLAGHVSVPLFPSLSKDAIRRILMHAEASVLFAGKLDNWPSQREGIPQGIKIIGLPLLDDPSVDRWDAVIAEQEPIAEPVQHSADTLATIIYTSGTTGDPKGVMHSFGSLASAVGHASDIYRVSSRDRVLSYLPLSHVAERLVVELASLYEGFTVFFVESLETFTEDIQRAQPTLFFAVPRVWSLFRQGVLERIPENLFDAILYIPVCSSALRRMVLKELGLHKTRLFLSGGAPLAESVLQWYAKLGVQILESYGLTENMGYSHCTREHDQWAGYVGLPNPGVMVALSDAGEVLVRSATT